MEFIFGLPAHPLFVHLTVVLVPVAALSLIAVSWIKKGRVWYAPVVGVLGVGSFLSLMITANTGEALEEDIAKTELVKAHVQIAESDHVWVFVLMVLALLTAFEPQIRQRRPSLYPRMGMVVAVLATVVGLIATVNIIRIGHSGAKATWEGEVSLVVDAQPAGPGQAAVVVEYLGVEVS